MKSTNKRIILLFIVLFLAITLCSCSERTASYTHTVTFESNGGTALPMYEGTEISTMPVPKMDGYTFEGWYKERDFSGDRVVFPIVISENITLYAKYIDNSIGNLELVYNLIEGAYEITEYNGSSYVIYIPEKHNGLPVTRLCKGFIKNLYNTNILYISQNINEIEEDLYKSRRLSAINVSGNNEVFSSLDGILYDKARITLICYPAGRLGPEFTLADETITIAPNAIRNNIYLQIITLNKNVNSLEDGMFDLINLRSFVVPAENENFSEENSVLYNKDKTRLILYPSREEVKHFTVPETVVEMAEKAFYNAAVHTINIGEKVTTVSAMRECKYLRKINVAEGNPNFSSIDGVLFDNSGKTLIKFPSRYEEQDGEFDYTFPAGVESISSFAFDNIIDIKKLLMNAKLTEISSYAFSGECSVEEIHFTDGSKLHTIQQGGLVRCKNLTKLVLTVRKPPTIYDKELNIEELKIYVPENMRGLYEVVWSSYKEKISNGKAIPNYTVIFNSNGGSFIGNVTGGYIITEPVPSKENHSFLGWYDNIDGTGSRHIFPLVIEKDVTLYAIWN